MEVEGYYFRSWSHLKLTFSLGKITVLKGPSGIGKSTIFHLIRWILYGQGRNITPASNPRAKTIGKLTLHSIQIIRRRSPNTVHVDVKGKKYEEEEAQDVINTFFGSSRMFEMTSWIEQKNINAFFNLSNVEKLECLRNFAIGEDDPQSFLTKLDSQLEEEEKTLVQMEKEFNRGQGKLSAYQDLGYSESNLLSADEKEDLRSWITKQEKKIRRQEKRKEEQIRWESKSQQLQSTLKRLQAETLVTPIKPISKKDLHLLQEIFSWSQQQQKIEKELAKLPLEKEEISSWTIDDYNRTKNLEEDYQKNLLQAQSLRLPYREEAISSWIKEAQIKIIALEEGFWKQELIREQVEEQKIRKKLDDYPLQTIVPVDRHDEITSLTQDISTISSTINGLEKLLHCPSCEEALLYNQGKLIFPEGVDVSMEIDPLKTKLKEKEKALRDLRRLEQEEKERYRQQENNRKQRISIEKELAIQEGKVEEITKKLSQFSLPPDYQVEGPFNRKRIKDGEEKIAQASRIVFISLPEVSSEEIKNSLQQTKHQIRRKDLQKQYQEIQTFTEDRWTKMTGTYSIEDYPSLSKRYQEYRRSKAVWETKSKEIEETEKMLAAVPSFKPTIIPELKAEKEKWEKELQAAIQAETYFQLLHLQSQLQTKLNTHNEVIGAYRRLRQIVLDTECQVYSNTLEGINLLLQEIIKQLFVGDLVVSLQPFKESKLSKQTKQQINLEITYQGAKFDNVRQLSGGETDRLSLALTLAFLRQTNFPLLLLDETLGSLDEDTKIRALEVIRQYTDGVVLVIQHEGSEDLFDEEVDVSDYRD